MARRSELVRRRRLAGYTQESLAHALGVDRTTVARWESGDAVPMTLHLTGLAAVLDVTAEVVESLLAGGARAPENGRATVVSPSTRPFVAWLVRASGDRAAAVADRIDAALRDPGSVRPIAVPSAVPQDRTAAMLADYYGADSVWRPYRATSPLGTLMTTVLTREDWLDLSVPVGTRVPDLRFVPAAEVIPDLDDDAARAAVDRLADAVANGATLVNRPLYRLTGLDVGPGGIAGTVGVSEFAHYALTLDLLERELTDAAGGAAVGFSLRDRFLPDIASVTDVGSRLCVGGALALTAIARPGTWRNDGDYLLLVQERSDKVLNARRRLAVIPKGFHGPLNDVAGDAPIGATLLRELEEELFGREDVDSTIAEPRHADPMHPSHLSAPMAWLAEHDDGESWRAECTGVGFNLVNGNYEFASLIVIDDESWWERFGGQVEANWEAHALRRYSSRDPLVVDTLAHDPSWSGEGLFALLQGLRRLAETGGRRVDLPSIELEP